MSNAHRGSTETAEEDATSPRRLRSITAVRRSGGAPTCHVFGPEHGSELRRLVATNHRKFRFFVCLTPRKGGEEAVR